MAPVWAKVVLTPGAKPTAIEPGREPFTFAHPPTIRTTFGRDQPFLDGEIAYGYTGRVVTPIQRGSDIVAPAGSPAYGVPMQGSESNRMSGKVEIFPRELVWCAVTHKAGSAKLGSVCLFNEGLGFGGYDSLLTTGVNFLDRDPYGGGEIVPAPFDLGAPVHVRYYVQNLGKIARIKGQVWIGDQVVNQWGYIFGDIGRGSQPAERLFSVGGGVIGITPDPADHGHYTLRIISPLTPDGRVHLGEKRNDSRVKEMQ
ncbi:hypothetical protein [uncultured Sphingomonas sp.]|uniref:hypothetical protein n=1 Tax=uncultured Sphingomonas sp. TaxID=158754 RepID=UPI0035C95BF1